MDSLRHIVEQAWDDRNMIREPGVQDAIRAVIESLDKGEIRVAEHTTDGWKVNEWVKKRLSYYFSRSAKWKR